MSRKHSKPIAICPYLRSIGRSSPEPLARPDYLHCCTANQRQREVAPRTQIVFCLIDQYTTCPFFSAALPESAPAGAEEGTG